MLEFISCTGGVIALEVSGKITSADLDAIMDRVEEGLEKHDKLHMFVETRAIDGIELSGLPAHIARAMPLFGKLRNFGRVAVVADQAWMRFATRLESAMLPYISYRVFPPEKRDVALAWVTSGNG
jgi:hypothetical protein